MIPVLQHIFAFIFYGSLYFTFESHFNAIFTKPHRDKINEILRSDDEQKHWINSVGFTKLFMFYMSGLLGLKAYMIFNLLKSNYAWYIILSYGLSSGLYFTIIEFVTGFLVYLILKVRLWDYRKEHLNFLGFTSLKHYGLWTLMGYFVYLVNIALNYIFK